VAYTLTDYPPEVQDWLADMRVLFTAARRETFKGFLKGWNTAIFLTSCPVACTSG